MGIALQTWPMTQQRAAFSETDVEQWFILAHFQYYCLLRTNWTIVHPAFTDINVPFKQLVKISCKTLSATMQSLHTRWPWDYSSPKLKIQNLRPSTLLFRENCMDVFETCWKCLTSTMHANHTLRTHAQNKKSLMQKKKHPSSFPCLHKYTMIAYTHTHTSMYAQTHPHPTIGPTYLGVQGFLDADASLDTGLSSLNLSHNAFNVLQFIAPIPKDSRVLDHLQKQHNSN